ncbi:UDP-glycosyltransferase family, conserved site [Sesbania bispinosa]|nr:UDP-glycosyltransferase family, conserved site [Sesbania bispinosa]
MESIIDESEYFILPGIPDKIEITKAQTGLQSKDEGWKQFNDEMVAAEMASYGVIINSFEELEPSYAKDYKKVKSDKVWCIGPVSLCNKDHMEKVQREIGLALEASKRPFIWVIREGNQLETLEKWIKEDGFEERTNDRSLIIRGWAPQLVILSHPAIGGFVTHCGWNSTLETICAGVPMLTWPLFGDQFLNEVFIVQILEVGVKVGVKCPVTWGEEEEIGVLVKKEDIVRAIERLMDETSESDERRKRIRALAEKAKNVVEKGGSSRSNVTLLIQDIMEKAMRNPLCSQ